MTQYFFCKDCGSCVDEFCNKYKELNTLGQCIICKYKGESKISQPIKIVPKEWGSEEWLANSPLYCSKILFIKNGCGTSIHHHKHKFETMYSLFGSFRIYLEGNIFELYEGEILNIAPYQIHKIDAIDNGTPFDSQLLEISTQHFDDDSIRHGRDLEKYLNEL